MLARLIVTTCIIVSGPTVFGAYDLPPLRYDTWALQPVIGMETVDLHWGKHFKGYITNLNRAFNDVSAETLEAIQRGLVTETATKRNNGGGAYNHGLYFATLAPASSSLESDIGSALLAKINAAFSSVAGMKTQFLNSGKSVFGSGWVWVAVNPAGDLEIVTTPNQDNPLMNSVLSDIMVPLFGADVWEHAYYLDFKNDRGSHLESFFTILNWKQVTAFYDSYGVNNNPIPASAFTQDDKLAPGFLTTTEAPCKSSAMHVSLPFAAIMAATAITHATS